MKKIIITSLISLSTFIGISANSLALADTGNYQPEYAFYLGLGGSWDFNNTNVFEDSTLQFKKHNKYFIVPEGFIGYNLDLTSGVELNFSDNNYTNSNNLMAIPTNKTPTTTNSNQNLVLESHGYTGMLQFIGNYPLTYDQKLNVYGLIGVGATYWRSALNGEDARNNFEASGVIGTGLSYKVIDEIEVSAGYKFSYLGRAYDEDYLESRRIMRHQVEVRLKFNI